MSVDNMIPEIWSARLLVQFDRMNVWQPLFNDISSELSMGGDTVHIGEITSTVTIGDHVRNTAVGTPDTITTADSTLTVDQMKEFSFMLDDVDAMQTRPMLMDEVARKTGVQMGNIINDYLRGIFEATVPSATPDNQLATANNTDHAEFAEQLLAQMLDVWEAMTDANIPLDQRYVVMSTKVAKKLIAQLVGETNDSEYRIQAFIQALMPHLYGFRPIIDKGIDKTGAKQHRVYLGRTNPMGNLAVYQIRTLEGFRSQTYFADVIRGLYVYGAKVIEPDWNYYIQPAA